MQLATRTIALLLAGPVLGWGPPAFGDVRDPVLLQATSNGAAPLVNSAGDVSTLLFTDALSESLSLRLSDGRGITWSADTPIDAPGTSDFISFRETELLGDLVFVAWADDRHYQVPLWPMVASTPYLRVLDTSSGVLGPELQIPTGTLAAHTSAYDYDLAVAEVGGAVHVHLASYRRLLDTLTGQIDTQVFLYSSHDGGATWLAPQTIAAPGQADYGDLRVLADGNDVHVFWTHEAFFNQPQLYHQRSSDGGVTLDFAGPDPVPAAYEVLDWDVDVDGATLALAWTNFASDFGFSQASFRTSLDRGDTFEPLGSFGSPTLFLDQAYSPRIAINHGSLDVTVVGAGFDFDLTNWIVASHSSDGGATWQPSQALASGSVKNPEVVASGSGRARVSASWMEGSGFTGRIRAATSLDGGASFGLGFEISSIVTAGSYVAWNDRYQNALLTFAQWAAPKSTYVGGYRPQAISPSGFQAGSTSISAGFEAFDSGADLAWLLLSTTTTGFPLPLGDGRELGLGLSPLFTQVLPIALGGALAAPLGVGGTGSLGPLPLGGGVPPGLTLYAVGLGFDLQSVSFTDISDVVTLDT